jgi:hypothetical protein
VSVKSDKKAWICPPKIQKSAENSGFFKIGVALLEEMCYSFTRSKVG